MLQLIWLQSNWAGNAGIKGATGWWPMNWWPVKMER
jgi:hypothetical protein